MIRITHQKLKQKNLQRVGLLLLRSRKRRKRIGGWHFRGDVGAWIIGSRCWKSKGIHRNAHTLRFACRFLYIASRYKASSITLLTVQPTFANLEWRTYEYLNFVSFHKCQFIGASSSIGVERDVSLRRTRIQSGAEEWKWIKFLPYASPVRHQWEISRTS